MGQSQVYANLGSIRGFIQLAKGPTIVFILFPGFSTLIIEPNAVSQHYWELFCQTNLCETQRRNRLGLRNLCGTDLPNVLWCLPADSVIHWYIWDIYPKAEYFFSFSHARNSPGKVFYPLYSERLSHNLEKVKEKETWR